MTGKKQRCFNCNNMRACKSTGKYIFEGTKYDIWVCQWCRAAETKRKLKDAEETE